MTEFWSLYPLSTAVSRGEHAVEARTQGSMHTTPDRCADCSSLACTASPRSQKYAVRECPFGYSYFWIDDIRLALGFVAMRGSYMTKHARRNARQDSGSRVSEKELERSIAAAESLPAGALDDFQRNIDAVVKGMIADPELRKQIAAEMRREFAEVPLQQSHDFMQFVNQIRGNVEVLLRKERPDADPYDTAQDLPQLGAIFFASQLMRAKIDSLAYLQESNRIFGSERKLRVHPLVLKYVRIYHWQTIAKKLSVKVFGESRGDSFYNPDALGVVIHALLDNQVKYAPAGSGIEISFAESARDVSVTFGGLGPKIGLDERVRIFEQGYRGRAAKGLYADGMGVGLASAGLIGDALGIDLRVSQQDSEDLEHRDLYWTSFSITLALT
jgi:signal transduction histidine kinase